MRLNDKLLLQSYNHVSNSLFWLSSTFASLYLEKLTEPQLKMYDSLINKPTNDWEIYYWMIGIFLVLTKFNEGAYLTFQSIFHNAFN